MEAILSLVTTATDGTGCHHCCICIRAEHGAACTRTGTLSKLFTHKLCNLLSGRYKYAGPFRDGADKSAVERARRVAPVGMKEKFADWAAHHKLSFIGWAVAMTAAGAMIMRDPWPAGHLLISPVSRRSVFVCALIGHISSESPIATSY